MEAKELRTGVCVYRTVEDFEPLEEKKVIVWDEGIFYMIGDCVDSLDNYEPIRLTEEWLVRFGFECCDLDEVYFLKDVDIQFWDHNNTFHFVSNHGLLNTELKYVHQLQNLYFALTGEDLVLKE